MHTLPVLRNLPLQWLPLLLSSDADIYPSPLTLSTLVSWVATCPAFALQYMHPAKSSGEVIGVCIVLPILATYWEQLISGKLKEWEITPDMLWEPGTKITADCGLGLHIWHIERLPGWDRKAWGSFGKYAWRDIDGILQSNGIYGGSNARKDSTSWIVRGYSALAVTEDGMRLFRDGLRWHMAPEYDGQWVLKDSKTQRTWIAEKHEWHQTDMTGYVIAGDCRMLVKRLPSHGRNGC